MKEQVAADEIWPDNLDLNGIYELPESKRQGIERRLGTSLYTLGAFPVEYTFFGDQFRAEWQADPPSSPPTPSSASPSSARAAATTNWVRISQKDFSASALFRRSEDREVPIVSQMRIYEYTRYQTKVWEVEELRKKYNSLKASDKDGRETLLRQIGDAYLKTPVMYDEANLLVVPHASGRDILPHSDCRAEGRQNNSGHTPPSSARRPRTA